MIKEKNKGIFTALAFFALFLLASRPQAVVLGLHDEPGCFLGGIAVMIGEGAPLRDGDAGRRNGGEKFVRVADAGEGETLARFHRRDGGGIGHQPAVQHR